MAQGWMRGLPKDMKKLARDVQRHPDWSVKQRKGGHIVFVGPTSKVFCSMTASDHRAIRNIKRDLAHAGLALE